MTFLDQLRTTDAVPKRDLSPAGRFRRRLVDALDQQAALAKAEAANETYVPTKQRWVRNKTSGDKELKVIPIRVRRWWKDETGKVFLSLKPGGRLIEIAPGKRSIEIIDSREGDLADTDIDREHDECDRGEPSLGAPETVRMPRGR